MSEPVLVGLIADTHDELDRRVANVFVGVSHIVHAGDVGSAEVLGELEALAPVTAVQGNTDAGLLPWLETREIVQVGGCRIRVLHDLDEAGGRVPHDARVVVSGHTHVPCIVERNGVLFVNPGSASLPRGSSSASVALLKIDGDRVSARVVEL